MVHNVVKVKSKANLILLVVVFRNWYIIKIAEPGGNMADQVFGDCNFPGIDDVPWTEDRTLMSTSHALPHLERLSKASLVSDSQEKTHHTYRGWSSSCCHKHRNKSEPMGLYPIFNTDSDKSSGRRGCCNCKSFDTRNIKSYSSKIGFWPLSTRAAHSTIWACTTEPTTCQMGHSITKTGCPTWLANGQRSLGTANITNSKWMYHCQSF